MPACIHTCYVIHAIYPSINLNKLWGTHQFPNLNHSESASFFVRSQHFQKCQRQTVDSFPSCGNFFLTNNFEDSVDFLLPRKLWPKVALGRTSASWPRWFAAWNLKGGVLEGFWWDIVYCFDVKSGWVRGNLPCLPLVCCGNIPANVNSHSNAKIRNTLPTTNWLIISGKNGENSRIMR